MSSHTPFSSSAAPAQQFRSGTRVAVIAALWNDGIVGRLLDGAVKGLTECGLESAARDVLRVPGSYEIPIVAQRCAQSGEYAAIIALGCVIRGETYHFELVADGVSNGLMRVMLDSGIPCINGVLTTENEEQAMARAGEGPDNKGWECAHAAAQLLHVLAGIGRPA